MHDASKEFFIEFAEWEKFPNKPLQKSSESVQGNLFKESIRELAELRLGQVSKGFF